MRVDYSHPIMLHHTNDNLYLCTNMCLTYGFMVIYMCTKLTTINRIKYIITDTILWLIIVTNAIIISFCYRELYCIFLGVRCDFFITYYIEMFENESFGINKQKYNFTVIFEQLSVIFISSAFMRCYIYISDDKHHTVYKYDYDMDYMNCYEKIGNNYYLKYGVSEEELAIVKILTERDPCRREFELSVYFKKFKKSYKDHFNK